jgi:hypothetical protein
MKSNNPSSQSSDITPEGSLQTSQTEGSRSVKEMAGDAKRSAGNMINQAKERASSMAQEQKQSAAQRIGRYGSALRDSARSVEQEDPNIAYFANSAAERIDRIADYLRSTDLDGLRRDAEDLARRRPALFMGGMLLAGLVVGSIIKVSATTARDEGENITTASDVALGDIEPLDSPDVIASRTGSSL